MMLIIAEFLERSVLNYLASFVLRLFHALNVCVKLIAVIKRSAEVFSNNISANIAPRSNSAHFRMIKDILTIEHLEQYLIANFYKKN